jgi:hypothetical protein
MSILRGPADAVVPAVDVLPDHRTGIDLGEVFEKHELAIRAEQTRGNLLLVFALGAADVLALRLGHDVDDSGGVGRFACEDGGVQFEYTTRLGAMRTKLRFPRADVALVRCTTSLVPSADAPISRWPRDLHVLGDVSGTVHTAQRGPRTGIVFATSYEPTPYTVFYLQDFSSLADYARATQTGWADTVGGRWPDIGFALPDAEERTLPKARELTLSDAYIVVSQDAPDTNASIAGHYLDLLAQIYVNLPLPAAEFHDWPNRARATLRDLSLSPLCTYTRDGRRYLMPYVGDDKKPPESMVQLTLAANVAEYDEWRGEQSALFHALSENVPSFFDERIATIVRWLPGASFDESQAESNMNHTAMDSWYLHHAMFNLFRLARGGNAVAKALFEKSLPYMMRVARRFDYRWPVFFDLETLDIIRAESAPGKGGETDVAGLYALVMIQAFEMFGRAEHLDEAKAAAGRLQGLGFNLAYQLNTTGFAAEATLRLWKMTGERKFLEISEVCMANVFDNLWLWRCEYGRAEFYRTFFGLFPLQEAPYIAAYEELEAQSKALEYLAMGGDDVRPSVRLLLAEFQKYALDRTWFYYPDSLPASNAAGKPRNGRVERALSIPLEDLQDGFSESGQVGQEVYGAGLAFVHTTRYFHRKRGAPVAIFCNYPLYDFVWDDAGRVTFRTGGDPRGSCDLRFIPASADGQVVSAAVTVMAGSVPVAIDGRLSAEGHGLFKLRGGQQVEAKYGAAGDTVNEKAVCVGPLASSARTS